MPVDQDWEAVWPGPRTFHPSAVPLPVRQGFVQHKMGVRPPKRANIELMKTPNFLHLTPPVVKKQATTLKELCTPWPPGNCFKAFPVLSTTTDYLNTSSSIRDARARQVDFEVSVDALTPDPRIRENIRILLDIPPQRGAGATFKFLAANCPTRKQNLDHAEFLLTAIYFESRKNDVLDRDERQPLAGADLTGEAAHHVLTEGECRSTLADYKKSVLKAKLS
ncbi:hypothetical protein TCAL_13636 [Tigriopus californicus]|uniref:Ribosomal protein S24/S35 mitochondrial conserved domain-containing protein n=2 Tax=Tigriopus californicus TaxID=6832 RepID=A0A553PLG1_TIGCA|nr:hypothetical protein TCAL_13636 [Tigriopus californicus]|eukprot:TCALIF_13636-PA protein Name:"Similar to MRPS35 28S ribosomal protein S35, mitochondrial (Homo sapiens)" AED:0.04 eAED:0.04 QI:0/0/0/1/1/1/2/0/221